MSDHIAALEAAPTCWTLSEALDRGETTCRGYLWFSDPQNSCWEPLYRGKAVEAILAEVKRLQAENFALAAGQCASVTGDEGGTPICEEVQRLREELAASESRADMHADLGRRTAEALGIPLEEGRAHMPEVAGKMRAENEALKSALLDATAYMLRHGGRLATDWRPATSDATRHEGEAIVEKAMKYVLLAEEAAQAVTQPAECKHQADPRGCYRVRCQLGRECVEAAQVAKEK
jgi:hypothetical protein